MGEGTTGVGDPGDVEREVERTRQRLTGIVRELDRRRHAAFDLRGQLRRHGRAAGVTVGALALLVGGGIWLGVWRKGRRARPLARAHRLRLAVARMTAHPDDVARPTPKVGNKVLSAFASAAAGVLARELAQRLMARPKKAVNRGPNRRRES
jgi:hypothetical protein